jgi:hypothetical protein
VASVVKTPVDARLLHQARQFALRFACEDCAHFASDGTNAADADARAACAHGYPPSPRRRALDRYDAQDAHDDGARTVEFCKEFELGAGDDDTPEGPVPRAGAAR